MNILTRDSIPLFLEPFSSQTNVSSAKAGKLVPYVYLCLREIRLLASGAVNRASGGKTLPATRSQYHRSAPRSLRVDALQPEVIGKVRSYLQRFGATSGVCNADNTTNVVDKNGCTI